ncbi:MAG TPA: DNA polymerase III subunit gamma/tau [Candidatus Saccharimonadales bacterium]|nr:DNA polymerase III subunit gamma/tau [Candidatus Saccharimonadales bacterium]
MGQALYRKYRSKSFDEVVGQDHVTTTLKNAIKSGKISHAYLLTGPRGVGKTSVARILAHEVNGLPYTDESIHLDIIEIDAASNRRIDEIRDLRDKVHIAPTSAKYKVYIIDEVHMLTKEAFNALLKTLEEPPEHVIFILATTEAHKLPETIVSRTQRFSFKPIDKSKATQHLEAIAKSENINASSEVFELIAEHGDGSFRDSISLLDQARHSGKTVTVDDVRQILGIPPKEFIDQLQAVLAQGTPKQLLDLLSASSNQGYTAATVAKQLGSVLREELINGNSQLDATDVTQLLRRLIDVPASPNPDTLLEVVLLDVVLRHTDFLSEPKSETPQAPKPKEQTKPKTEPELPEKPAKTAKVASKTDFTIEQWPAVLDVLKQRYSTLYGVIRMGQPSIEDSKLIIAFRFPFHKKRMTEARNQQIISDIIQEQTGQQIVIEAVVRKIEDVPADTSSLDTISNIFGSAEVVES